MTKVIARDSNGKFLKKTEEILNEPTDRDFILEVKDQIYNLYLEEERIKKAYALITGTHEYPNMRRMKLTVLAYE